MNSGGQGHRGKPGAAAGTKGDIFEKGDTAQCFPAVSEAQREGPAPENILWVL